MDRPDGGASHAHPEPHEPMDFKAAAAFFARVSRDLMEEPSQVPTSERIAERAVQVIPGCDHASIFVRRRRHRVESAAATSPLAQRCDELQYELEEGPCLEAVWEGDSYLIGDTSTDTRWPRWSPRVAAEGIGSVLSLRLATSTDTLGALNLYAEPAHGFSTDDVDLAAIYGLHATNAMNAAFLVEGLQLAVQSRHLIGVAQGILMQHYGLDLEQAFEVLRRYSSHKNVKLREVAEQIVESGDLPDRATLPG
jgi:GAF domain-containing protein